MKKIVSMCGLLFLLFGLGACASLGDIFFNPPPPEGYGSLSIKNIDFRKDSSGNPVTGYGIRSISVNGISDRTYSWSNTYGNIPGRVPAPKSVMTPNGYIQGHSVGVGNEIEWVAINKNGEEKQVKRQLLPFGDYEITVGWSTGDQTRHRATINGSSNFLELEVHAP